MLQITKIYESIIGEGIHAGRPAIFIRLHGCNLKCDFCEEEYTDYTEWEDLTLFNHLQKEFTDVGHVVFTGGEPTLQIVKVNRFIDLCNRLSQYEYLFHLETNGTMHVDTSRFFHVAVSPKVVNLPNYAIHELKIMHPFFSEIEIEGIVNIATSRGILIKNIFIQPISPFTPETITEIVQIAKNTGVRLGFQIHKFYNMK